VGSSHAGDVGDGSTTGVSVGTDVIVAAAVAVGAGVALGTAVIINTAGVGWLANGSHPTRRNVKSSITVGISGLFCSIVCYYISNRSKKNITTGYDVEHSRINF
jgi:multisubunit Na+/H+ antiporter MnhB subunit